MVIHLPIEAGILEEQSHIPPADMIAMTHKYIELIGAHVVPVSLFKGQSRQFTDDIVVFGSDVKECPKPEKNMHKRPQASVLTTRYLKNPTEPGILPHNNYGQ